jgi:hypothetical protein
MPRYMIIGLPFLATTTLAIKRPASDSGSQYRIESKITYSKTFLTQNTLFFPPSTKPVS